MSPTYKSLLTILFSGALFTLLLVSNQFTQQSTSESNTNSAELAAQQLTRQLSDNIDALSGRLTKLSNSSFWQNSAFTNQFECC